MQLQPSFSSFCHSWMNIPTIYLEMNSLSWEATHPCNSFSSISWRTIRDTQICVHSLSCMRGKGGVGVTGWVRISSSCCVHCIHAGRWLQHDRLFYYSLNLVVAFYAAEIYGDISEAICRLACRFLQPARACLFLSAHFSNSNPQQSRRSPYISIGTLSGWQHAIVISAERKFYGAMIVTKIYSVKKT